MMIVIDHLIQRIEDIRKAGAEAVRAEAAVNLAAEGRGSHAYEIRCHEDREAAVARLLGLITSPQGVADLAFLVSGLKEALDEAVPVATVQDLQTAEVC